MKKAWDLAKADPGGVCFINLECADFDATVILTPRAAGPGFLGSYA